MTQDETLLGLLLLFGAEGNVFGILIGQALVVRWIMLFLINISLFLTLNIF